MGTIEILAGNYLKRVLDNANFYGQTIFTTQKHTIITELQPDEDYVPVYKTVVRRDTDKVIIFEAKTNTCEIALLSSLFEGIFNTFFPLTD